MRTITLILLALTLALTACAAPSSVDEDAIRDEIREEVEAENEIEAEVITNEPEPEPEPEPGTYGSDPVLDRLQDECADGNERSCLDLFWDSPIDSEYEAYAKDHTDPSDRVEDFMGEDEGVSTNMLLQMTWDNLSTSDQTDICVGYLLAPREMYVSFEDGYGSGEGMPSFGEFTDFFDSVCT